MAGNLGTRCGATVVALVLVGAVTACGGDDDADEMVVRYVVEIEGQTDWESWLEQFAAYERWIANVHADVDPTVFRGPCCVDNPESMWFTAESFEAQGLLLPEWAESVDLAYGPSA